MYRVVDPFEKITNKPGGGERYLMEIIHTEFKQSNTTGSASVYLFTSGTTTLRWHTGTASSTL